LIGNGIKYTKQGGQVSLTVIKKDFTQKNSSENEMEIDERNEKNKKIAIDLIIEDSKIVECCVCLFFVIHSFMFVFFFHFFKSRNWNTSSRKR